MFLKRRDLLKKSLCLSILATNVSSGWASSAPVQSKWSTNREPNSYEDITSYNNFYEFGTDKSDPAKYAHKLSIDPWKVEIGGLVEKPGLYDFDDLIKGIVLEERIYAFRCVEGWSMVIPWVGFSLSQILKKIEPKSSAKYVAFETLFRPEEMFGQRYNILQWPYREGLTIAEAMHPLTILSTGLYGEELPKQNGAPLRLVVPWKYGFKSIKSIVKINLTDKQPISSWNMQNPREYGFFSNVNPDVDHPRWSQATERPIGKGLFTKRRKTLKFNGYGDDVASLYSGMDLRKYY
tara:strand:+ start:629 stop:1507 length:879 start_codon:yes stop_codon:yes gene_type:complete